MPSDTSGLELHHPVSVFSCVTARKSREEHSLSGSCPRRQLGVVALFLLPSLFLYLEPQLCWEGDVELLLFRVAI